MPNDATRATAGALPEISRRQLSNFIEACMDPLPDALLIDTAYNAQLRQNRQKVWRKAFNQYLFCKALDDASMRMDMPTKVMAPATLVLPSRDICLNELRKAYAALLRTPAYDRASVAWKKRQRTGGYYGFDADELHRIVEDDEAFLDATPVKRPPRSPGSKRSGREVV
jgi:hypothetical protein